MSRFDDTKLVAWHVVEFPLYRTIDLKSNAVINSQRDKGNVFCSSSQKKWLLKKNTRNKINIYNRMGDVYFLTQKCLPTVKSLKTERKCLDQKEGSSRGRYGKYDRNIKLSI